MSYKPPTPTTPEEHEHFLDLIDTHVEALVDSFLRHADTHPNVTAPQLVETFEQALTDAETKYTAEESGVPPKNALIAAIAFWIAGPAPASALRPEAGDVWHYFPPTEADGSCAPWQPWHVIESADNSIVMINPYERKSLEMLGLIERQGSFRVSVAVEVAREWPGEFRLAYRDWR